MGGGTLALLGFLPLRPLLEGGLQTAEEGVWQALRDEDEEEAFMESLRAALEGVDLEAPPARLCLAWSFGQVRFLSEGEEAPQGFREVVFALDDLLPGFDQNFSPYVPPPFRASLLGGEVA